MSARLLVGDAAAVLGTLEAGSVQLCVTSPPYFGLRRYDGPDTVWGGDPSCLHRWRPYGERKTRPLAVKAGSAVAIDALREVPATRDVQVDDIGTGLGEDPVGESEFGEECGQAESEGGTAGAEARATSLINVPVSVEQPAQEVPAERLGQSVELGDPALAWDDPVAGQAVNEFVGPEDPAEDGGSGLRGFGSDDAAFGCKVADELGEREILADEVDRAVVANTPIADHEAEPVGEILAHSSEPLPRDGMLSADLGGTVSIAGAKAGHRAVWSSPPGISVPARAHEGNAAPAADDGPACVAAGAGASFSDPDPAGLDIEGATASDTSNGGHTTMICENCGAIKCQLGLEPHPDLYLEHLVAIFAEVRRVLHATGILCVNMGDSMSGGGNQRSGEGETRNLKTERFHGGAAHLQQRRVTGGSGSLPAGNLLGMPWRLAFALQRDGWILRSAVTAIKKSPMPESVSGVSWQRCRVKVKNVRSGAATQSWAVGSGRGDGDNPGGGIDQAPWAEYTDCPGCEKCAPNGGLVLRWGSGRPTSAYEMLFIFAKSARYYFDCEAVRVPVSTVNWRPANGSNRMDDTCLRQDKARHGGGQLGDPSGRNAWNYQRFEDASDVWEWRPEGGFDGQHYATFPKSLPTWCIKAATPEAGCCSACGMPWARVVETETAPRGDCFGRKDVGGHDHGQAGTAYQKVIARRSLSWRPTCQCNAPARSALVLDPFAGAGTTLLAASRLGRDSIGVEISESYAAMSRERLTADAGLFADIGTE